MKYQFSIVNFNLLKAFVIVVVDVIAVAGVISSVNSVSEFDFTNVSRKELGRPTGYIGICNIDITH